MNNTGLGLIELLVGASLSAIVISAIGLGASGLIKLGLQKNRLQTAESDLTVASYDLQRVGRVAQACTLVKELVQQIEFVRLECSVSRNSSLPELYRFGFYDDGFQWRKFENGQFVKYIDYPAISDFILCDAARMSSDCPILPAFQRPNNRFFRYLLKTTVRDKKDPGRVVTKQVQSAFWVRHPNSDGLTYQWGAWNND